MRKRDRREFERYVRACADMLELRDWSTRVDWGQPDTPPRVDSATMQWNASSESIPGRKAVVLTFPFECRDWDLDELRQTVAHELLHAHVAPMWEMVRVDLHEHMVQATYDVFADGFRRWLEYGVDAMADIAVKNLPLIDWPAPKESR
jgi:hypothetical protein